MSTLDAFGERVPTADRQRPPGTNDLALCNKAVATGRGSRFTLNSAVSTSMSAGISVNAALAARTVERRDDDARVQEAVLL